MNTQAALRIQEVNPAKLALLYRKQFELCRVKSGETIAVVSDLGTRREYVQAAFAAADDLGADVYELCVNSIPSWTKVGVPTIGKCKGTLEAVSAADMLVIFHVPLFTKWLKQVTSGGTRVLMIIDAPDDLEQLMSPPGLKEACKHAELVYRKTKKVRVTSEAGTDLSYECGEYPVMTQWGYADEPGHFDHWGGGHIHTFPNEGSAHGTVVFQPGDIVILPYCRYVVDPVKLEIREGPRHEHRRRARREADARLARGRPQGRERPRPVRGFASRLGAQSAGALVRHRAERRRARAPPRGGAHVSRQLPLLDRPEHAGRRQARHEGPLRRADARLHGGARRER